MTNNSDTIKWLLYASDLTTRLGNDLPAISSHMYYEINQPGSGDVKIPLDSIEAGLVATGQFVQCWYRGAARGGFFIDNIVPQEINSDEYSGRVLSISGRGALSLLDTEIIYNNNSTDTKRVFTSVTKASILKTLIDEAKARGSLSTLTYDFTASLDSVGASWTDSENYELAVGAKLLDVARQFCKTGGFDFDVNLSGSSFVLSAYKAGLGTDKHTTVKLRAGGDILEAGKNQRAGKELVNVYLVRYKGGYITVSDSASIASHGRNVDFINIEQAQSSASATTYAAAKLALNKEPKTHKPVKVWDGNAPYIFNDYVMGDTVAIDLFGTETQDRILGLQLEFLGETFANVSIDFNTIFYDNEIDLSSRLSELEDLWATARDANLQEVSQWMAFGAPNGNVNASFVYAGDLYVFGDFTSIANISATRAAKYNLTTGVWSALGTGIPAEVLSALAIGTTIYAITAANVYGYAAGNWSLTGAATGGDIKCMATDGTNLFVGGNFTNMGGSAMNFVAKWTGSVWSNTHAGPATCFGLAYFNGTLYATFLTGANTDYLQYYSAGSWHVLFASQAKYYGGLGTDGNWLYYSGFAASPSDRHTFRYDGVGITYDEDLGAIGAWNQFTGEHYAAYLTDAYISTLGNIATYTNGILKLSGGMFTGLGGGSGNGSIRTISINGTDVYVGGTFTTIGGQSISYLAVYVTNFQSMIDHLANDGDNNFDLGAAIHNATAAAITDTGEVPFWDSVTSALRKITWANIKATIITAFGTMLDTLTGKTTPVDGDEIVVADSAASNASKKVTWANIKATLKTYFDTLYAVVSKGVTNGDSHDHDGGDGGTIAYSSLGAKPTVSGHTLNTDVTPISVQILPCHGLSGTIAASTTNYLPLFFYGINATNYGFISSRTGTLKNLSFITNTAQPASGSLVYTVQVNGSDTAITKTVAAGTAAGTFSDATHTAAVSAGDRVVVKVVNNATAASAQLGAAALEIEMSTT